VRVAGKIGGYFADGAGGDAQFQRYLDYGVEDLGKGDDAERFGAEVLESDPDRENAENEQGALAQAVVEDVL
jgi:hypothetical protein